MSLATIVQTVPSLDLGQNHIRITSYQAAIEWIDEQVQCFKNEGADHNIERIRRDKRLASRTTSCHSQANMSDGGDRLSILINERYGVFLSGQQFKLIDDPLRDYDTVKGDVDETRHIY